MDSIFKKAKEKAKSAAKSVADWFAPSDEGVRVRDVVREIPGATGKVAADIARSIPRSILSTALTVAPKKVRENIGEIRPGEDFGKIGDIFLGKEPIKTIPLMGKETLEGFGVSEESAKKYGPIAGIALTAADLYPGSAGKGKAVTTAMKEAGTGKNFISEIIKQLRPAEKEFIKERGVDLATMVASKSKAKPSEILGSLSAKAKEEVLSKVDRPTAQKSTSVPVIVKGKDGFEVMDGGHALAGALKKDQPIEFFAAKTRPGEAKVKGVVGGVDDGTKVATTKATASQGADEFVYHTTGIDSITGIRDKGLVPSKKGQYGPGVYFAPNEAATGGYGSREGVMLRVRRDKLPDDFQEFPGEQGWTNKNIPAEAVEFKLKGETEWKPISSVDRVAEGQVTFKEAPKAGDQAFEAAKEKIPFKVDPKIQKAFKDSVARAKKDPKEAEKVLEGIGDMKHISEVLPSEDDLLKGLGGKKPPVSRGTGADVPGAPKERRFVTRTRNLAPQADAFLKGEYTPRSTKELAELADEIIEKNYDEAVRIAKEGTDDRAVAIASRLIDRLVTGARGAKSEAEKAIMYEKVADVANEAARNLTEHGRAIQAATLLGQMTPEGMVRQAAREIQRYNEGVEKTMGGIFGIAKKVPELTAEQAKKITDKMEAIVKIEDPIEKAMKIKQLDDQIRSWIPSTLYQKISTIWKAGLLTGIKTTGLNILSNLSHNMMEIAKDAPAAVVDWVASKFTGKRTMAFTFKGAPAGVKEGASKGWRYFKTGFDERDIGKKLDYTKVNFGKGKIGKALEAYTETVFRSLGTQDQPFYYGARLRSLTSQAIAAAKNEGLKGDALAKRVQDLVNNPTDDMIKFATMDAEMAVFQNKTWLGQAAKALQNIPGGQFVVPFTRTPAAVATMVWNYSPGGLLATVVKNIGKGRFNQREFAQGIGRGVMGTVGALYIGRKLQENGLISLAWPTSEKERELWEMEGRKPNTIKIGGKWRSPAVLGPFGLLVVVGAHMEKAVQENGSPAGAIALLSGIGSTLTEQSFLQGVNQAIDAIKDPERSFNGFAMSFVGSWIPTIVADVARSIDDSERITRTPIERLQSRIPGVREGLEPKVSTFGEDEPTPDFFTAMFDPTRPAEATADANDPLVKELRRLQDAGYPATPTQLGPNKGYKSLTPEQNTLMWKLAGKYAKKAIGDVVGNRMYGRFDDEEKAKEINDAVDDAKVQARARVVYEITKGMSAEEARQKLAEMKEEGLLTNQVYGAYLSYKRRQ